MTADALDGAAIAAALASATRTRLRDVEVVDAIDSTNAELLRRSSTRIALLAGSQSAGRGRRGRAWTSPPGANLYLSLAWPAPPSPGLPLALGVATAEALADPRIRVKWPNDLVADGRKLGGLLIEASGGRAVIGLGLNVRMPAGTSIDQPWTDLATLGAAPSRNALAARVLDAWIAALLAFESEGLAAFGERWARRDALAGERVRVLDGAHVVHGIARGIAADGALRVDVDGTEARFHSAEVSVRRQAA